MIKTIGTVLLAVALTWGGIALYEDVGESIFTAVMTELAQNTKPRVLASTYVVTGQSVTINTWLVDTSSRQVVSTGSFEMAMNQEIEELLRGASQF